MKINRAYRYELKPNKEQLVLLAKYAGCARFSYNWGLARRIELYEKENKSTNAIEQHKELNSLKQEQFPWMYEVSKCAPQEALRDLDKAFRNFYRGLKTGNKVGFPKFKKKGGHDSFRLTGCIKVMEKAVQLPRLGVVKLKEKPKVNGRILSATVSRDADRWYVSLTVEQDITEPEPVKGEVVVIDFGLKHFAVFSTGEVEDAPNPLKKHLKLLRKRSKQHSRKQKGSNNRKKSAMKFARFHRKIRNIRTDYIHKFTSNLAKTKQEIVIEDFSVKELMAKGRFSRHFTDIAIGEAKRMLEYKTKWYGSVLTKVPKFHSVNNICSNCGIANNKIPPVVKQWTCTNCGTQHSRSENSAKNLRKLREINTVHDILRDLENEAD